MIEKKHVYLPIKLAEKLEKVLNEEELLEEEVVKYIRQTKNHISGQVELLDDDILMFKGKLASYKKAFKEAYTTADEEMYSFWEKFDKDLAIRSKSMSTRLSRLNKIYEEEFTKKKFQIEKLSKSMEEINTYSFERILTFLRSFQSLDDSTKNLFKELLNQSGGE